MQDASITTEYSILVVREDNTGLIPIMVKMTGQEFDYTSFYSKLLDIAQARPGFCSWVKFSGGGYGAYFCINNARIEGRSFSSKEVSDAIFERRSLLCWPAALIRHSATQIAKLLEDVVAA